MSALDLVLVGLTLLFALLGWRQGLIRSALSMVGFVLGAVIAVALLPRALSGWEVAPALRGIAAVVGVLAAACLGQLLAAWLGRLIRDWWTWRPAQVVDSIGGAALFILALAVLVWVAASAVALLPDSSIGQQVRASRVVAGLDLLVPGPARSAVDGLQSLARSTDFPRVFDTLVEPTIPADPPDPEVLAVPAVRSAAASLVRIEGEAAGCDSELVGSGFVFAPQRVMTNAHVVAGVEGPTVRVLGTGPALRAEVVVFDPATDVAVLFVPGLRAPALAFGPDAAAGAPAVVAGFPGGGPLDAEPARIRGRLAARGDDIYGTAGVVRDVYALRASVRPGNSGGPLLSPQGRVYGVVFAAAVGSDDTGYALTASAVRDASRLGRAATRPVDTGACLP